MKIGIIGLGFVGGALEQYLRKRTNNDLRLVDPKWNLNENVLDTDCIFISVPVPTTEKGTLDLSILEGILKKLKNYNNEIFIRSTLLPGTTDKLARLFNLKLFHMPEFLTERTALDDFYRLDLICGGEDKQKQLLNSIFTNKKITIVSNKEAELIKHTHNSFLALKVTYFNIIKDYCEKEGMNYELIREGVQISGFINPNHTQIPGPDGKYGFGGHCFPKDLKAFFVHTKHKLFKLVLDLNEHFRQKETK